MRVCAHNMITNIYTHTRLQSHLSAPEIFFASIIYNVVLNIATS